MDLWTIGLISVLATGAATPIVRRLLIRYGVVDHPNSRSSHHAAIPRGGGVACILGMSTGSAVAAVTGHNVPWTVLAAAIALALIGFIDDRSQLTVLPRLVAQILVGALLGGLLGGALWIPIGAIAFTLFVNVVNFMDGINGITALTLGLWGATAAVGGSGYGSPALVALGVVTAGTAIGFLPWNAPRAKIFLGDVGSYFFGALVAGGILLGASDGVPAILIGAPLAVFLVDVTVVLVRRTLRRATLAQAHREHVYQRLVDRLKLPHILVSVWAAFVAGLVTLLLSNGPGVFEAFAATALILIYLASVALLGAVASAARGQRSVDKGVT